MYFVYTNRSQSNTENGGNSNQWNREHVKRNRTGSWLLPDILICIILGDRCAVNSARGDLDFSNAPHDGSTKVTTFMVMEI